MNKIRFTSLLCGGALALSLALPVAPARSAEPMAMTAPNSTALGALASTQWELISPNYAGLTERPTLQFDQDRVSASVGLNRIGGDARVNGKILQISPLFSTKMAGPTAQMNAEFRYSQALQNTRTFAVSPDGQTLTLRGAQTLKFQRAAMMMADPLASTQWELASPAYANLDRDPTLQFADNRMSASVGLNGLGAAYAINGSQISFEQFLSTQMAGSPALMSAEDNYKKALVGVRTFAVSPDGQTLTLSGAETLTFAAMAPMQKSAKAGLSTHVLDTTRGKPGNGVVVKLYRMNGETGTLVRTAVTNADGRVPELLSAEEMQIGVYQIVFKVGPYFQMNGTNPETMPFLDEAVVRFGIGEAGAHYHVPITVTPYSYGTYRGS